MSEREQTPRTPGAGSAQHEQSTRPVDEAWREQTTPGITPVPGGSTAAGSGTYGYPGAGENHYTAPQYSTQPPAIRRADTFAALLLILAGIAAGVSLLLSWLPRVDARGWDILRLAFDKAAADGWSGVLSSGFWQPLAILFGGGVLFVLGLLMLIPARAHRFLGLLALLVTFAVAAGVLVPLADNRWALGDFRVGFYLAIAVAALGLLGSLKALLTGPKRRTTSLQAS
jgi:hypothetical protein